MRNREICSVGRFSAIVMLMLAAGCAHKAPPEPAPPSPEKQAVLDAGFVALESKHYNEALAKADEFLASLPHSPASAEALYLKGRALEGKNSAGSMKPDEIAQNLKEARLAYIQALDLVPKQPLESYVRASLANVAYFQDDYPTAISQWSAAYAKLDRDDLKAWAMYRIGVSQQRLGQFTLADQTFAKVQEAYPNTIPAQRAKEHQGARAFYVQLATFAAAPAADAAVADLKGKGISAARVNDTAGHSLLRIGPVASYGQAQYFKTQLAGQYPDAIVLP